jgi:serine/threonine-protein kinase
MAWFGVTDGKIAPLRTGASDWSNVSFSPDGSRLAVDISSGKTTNIWVYELGRDPPTPTQVTFGPGDAQRPVWTPDGKRIVFASTRDGALNLYWQRADGVGDAQRLTETSNAEGAWSWHPSGKLLAYHELTPNNQDDVLILPIEGDETSGWKPGKPIPFLNGPYAERAPMFSPDGRWLAYQSTETGRDEVYVRPYPGPGGKRRISTDGGQTPTWSSTKRELFYTTLDQQLMVASYTVDGDSFQADRVRPVSDVRLVPRFRTGPTRSFDLHPDGTRFVLAPADNAGPTTQDKLLLVFNFFDELRRIAPTKK